MPSFSLSSTYLIPAILLNPAFILHLVNTFVSHLVPPANSVSTSPHPVFETLGPVPGSKLYLDMHADDQLCWGYTVIMVFVQVLVFGRVQDNRVRRKSASAAKLEREKIRKEKLRVLQEERASISNSGSESVTHVNGGVNGKTVNSKVMAHPAAMDGVWDLLEECPPVTNGAALKPVKESPDPESEASFTETSEEEMFI